MPPKPDIDLPLVEAPETIWTSIEGTMRKKPIPIWRWALAAAAMLTLTAVLWHRNDGWIQTDAHRRSTIEIGNVGTVEVDFNTRLRIVTERPDEYRLALVRGKIHATISAPPRHFFVDTASGTAVDLGCEYDLTTDDRGAGLLRVTKGWVSFECKGLESLVPAGASCRTHAKTGPGVPYFDDATDKLRQALEEGSLGVVLDEARRRDTLTLWHLLSRAAPADRARVFDRIAALTKIPAGVSREKALALDPLTLTRLKDELAWTW